MDERYPGPDDIRLAAALCHDAFLPLAEHDWSVRAGELEWSAHTALAHIPDGQIFYAVHLAARAGGYIPGPFIVPPHAPVRELLAYVPAAAAVVAELVSALPAGTRVFHFWGRADASGFAAMSCDELLIHSDDIARGFGLPFRPPAPLCRRVVDRLFPWAPPEVDPWSALRWANNRLELPGHGRIGPGWYWHCAPLAEWDGSTPLSAGGEKSA